MTHNSLGGRLLAAAALTLALVWNGSSQAQANASSGAYRAGLKIAKSRNYSNPDCYARVFVRHARRNNHHDKPNYWSAKTGSAFKGELWSECGISR